MGQSRSCVRTVAIGETSWWSSAYYISVRYARSGVVWLGILGALIADGGGIARNAVLLAQTPSPALGRLSVRPHEMATGTRTDKAGEQELDSLQGVLIYVPKQCVGTRRCPLVVFLHGEAGGAREAIDMQSQLADKYRMILLAPDNIKAESGILDAAMKQVLRKFAIDPNKIALAGEATGGVGALFFGRKNFDVFSRIAPLSAAYPRPIASPLGWMPQPAPAKYPDDTSRGPKNGKTQLLVAVGIAEAGDDLQNALETARLEQQDGHTVKSVLNLRPRPIRLQDRDYMWHWLQDSWASPSHVARVTPAPPVPLLTAEAFSKMAGFWISLMAGSDSIWAAGFKGYQKEITIPVGQDQMTVFDMVDIRKLAAKYPSVAAGLTRAGLTTQQEEDYRIAIISARATKVAGSPGAETSVQGKNVAFINASPAVANALLGLMGVPRCEDSGGGLSGCKQRGSFDIP